MSAAVLAAYAAPAVAFAIPTIPLYVYLPAVYADDLGLGLTATGTAILIARVFDALSDPVVGYFSDTVRSRLGLRKPWIIAGALVAAAGMLLVALPPGHPLAGADPVPLDALAAETWVASRDPGCKRLLSHAAGRAGFTPKVAFASDDYGAVGRLVLAGVGVALVPALAAAAVGDCVPLRRLDPAPARRISVAVAAAHSTAAGAMLAILTTASDRSTSSAPAGASA